MNFFLFTVAHVKNTHLAQFQAPPQLLGCIIWLVFVVHDIGMMFGVTATISIDCVDYMCFFLRDLSFVHT